MTQSIAAKDHGRPANRACLYDRMKRFLFDAGGNVTVAASLSIPALMGAVGLAADFAQFASKQSAMQSAADASAIAAAMELSISTSTDAAVQSLTEAYVATAISDEVSTTALIDRKNATVQVRIKEAWTPFFAHYLGAKITPISVTATAKLVGQNNICVLTLDDDGSSSLALQNKSAITANGCSVYANSKSPTALSVKGKSVISADLTCSAGGISSTGTITPSGLSDCPVMEDPLASRPTPSVAGCNFTNTAVNSGTVTLSPGTYCGGIGISGDAVVTLEEGIYVIKDGKFSLSQTASLTGKHVGFYLSGTDATLYFVGATSVDLSGPADGIMAGLLIYGDPGNASIGKHVIRSSNAHTLTGTIYLPRGELLVDPGVKVGQNSAYTAIVVDRLKLDMGPELVLNSNYGATDVPVPDGIRSSSNVVLSD